LPLSTDPKIKQKLTKISPLLARFLTSKSIGTNLPRASKKVKNPHTTLPIHALIKLHIRADLPLYSPFRTDIKDINLRCITGIP
jgi:hypothetical protein